MAIMESTPHIYVTMIPVSKDESMVSAHYSTQMSSMVQVQTIGSKRPLKSMRVLEGHSDEVCSVAVSSDGRLIASASWDGTIKAWDFQNGEEIMTLADKSKSVNFFPDGRRLASASFDGDLRIWDVQTGEVILGPLQGQGCIYSVAISLDGTRVASGYSDGSIVLWDMSGGTKLKRFAGDRADVLSIAFSPDGSLLASGSSDGSTRIWEVDSGEPTLITFANTRECHLVSFTSDGKYIVSSCSKQIRIYEVESGSVAFVFDGFRAHSCFPCGTRAVVRCGSDADFSIMDLANGKVVSCPFEGHSGEINSVAITPGRHIISGSSDKTVRIWDAAASNDQSKTFVRHKGVRDVTISDDGSLVASYSGQSTIIWDAQAGDVIAGPLDARDGTCMAFSPDNSRLVLGCRRISVWDVATGQLAFSPIKGYSEINCISISPDGTMMASGHDDGTLQIWGMATGQPIAGPLDVFTDEVTLLEFSPNGNRLASGSESGNITVWNTATWVITSEFLTKYMDRVRSMRFSLDSTQIAFESEIKRDTVAVSILDVEEGHLVAGPFGLPDAASSLVFTFDGLYHTALRLAWNNFNISVRKLLDADGASSTYDPLVLRCFEGIRSNCSLASSRDSSRIVSCLASSRDSSRIVSCLDEETIRVWDVSDLLLSKRCEDGANALSKWTLGDDGWIVAQNDDEKRSVLMWVPHDLRPTLCQLGNTAVLNCKFFTKLDFLGAVLGDRWSECFVPSHRRALA